MHIVCIRTFHISLLYTYDKKSSQRLTNQEGVTMFLRWLGVFVLCVCTSRRQNKRTHTSHTRARIYTAQHSIFNLKSTRIEWWWSCTSSFISLLSLLCQTKMAHQRTAHRRNEANREESECFSFLSHFYKKKETENGQRMCLAGCFLFMSLAELIDSWVRVQKSTHWMANDNTIKCERSWCTKQISWLRRMLRYVFSIRNYFNLLSFLIVCLNWVSVCSPAWPSVRLTCWENHFLSANTWIWFYMVPIRSVRNEWVCICVFFILLLFNQNMM